MTSSSSEDAVASSSSEDAALMKYDVFISFRREDTRAGFTSHLHAALNRANIYAYVDYKIQKEDGEWTVIGNAIKESASFIVVFSENYSSSEWCLHELVQIMQRSNKNGQGVVLPVFYHIDPSDVRNQTGSYDVALAEQNMQSNDHHEIQTWKNALSQAANLPGFNFPADDRDEPEFIESIVEDVLARLRNANSDVAPEVSPTSQSQVVQYMISISHNVFQAETTWRVVGFLSCVVGLLCYALGPSFIRLFGRWNPFKVVLYVVLSLAILTTILFVKQASPSTRHVQLKKTCITFVFLMIISVYSFFYDRAVSGKPNIPSIISNAAFALVSVSLHRLLQFGVEMGVFSYFVSCFTIQLLTINWMLNFIAIIFGFLLFLIHSFLNSPPNAAIGREDNQV